MSDDTTEAMSSVARFAAMRRLQEAGANWGDAAQELRREPRKTSRRSIGLTLFGVLAVTALAMFGMGLGSDLVLQWRSSGGEDVGAVAIAGSGSPKARVAFLDATVESLQAFDASSLANLDGSVFRDGPNLGTSAFAVEVVVDGTSTPGVLKIDTAVRDVARGEVFERQTTYKAVEETQR